MAFDNDLHIPLRFYDAVEKQDRYKTYNTTKNFVQYTDATHLPEFQVKIDKSDNIATVKLVNTDTLSETSITGGSDFYEVDFTSYTYAIYDRSVSLSTIADGEYYIKLTTTSSDVYYSEVFVVGDISDKCILTYYNTNDLGGIDYTNSGHAQFKITFIFDATLAKPDYIIEEEGTEDGDGNVLLLFQRRVKTFKLWFYAPEYIADAMSLVPLHDFVTLTTHYGEENQESGAVYDFSVTTEWMENKGLAKITCEFRDSPVIKTTCANNIV